MLNLKKPWKIVIIAGAVLVLILGLAAGFLLLNDYHIEMALNGKEKITLEYGESFKDEGAKAALVGKWHLKNGKELEVSAQGAVDEKKLGEYTLTYSAETFGKEAQITRSVKVVDTKKPSLKLEGEEKITLTEGQEYKEPGFTAKDNYDGDLAKEVKTEGKVDTKKAGTYKLSYSVKDSSGNEASATREVVVKKKAVYQPTGSAGVTDKVTVIPGEKTVYLTFDDGPGPYTGKLLDILKKYNAKATFFVIDKGASYMSLLGRMKNEGHAIGIHTASHNYRKIYSSEEAFFNDVEALQRIIVAQTGSRSTLLRFPGGSSNTVSRFNRGVMSRLVQSVTEKGYRYFDWNVSSGDAEETTSTSQVARNVINGISGKQVSVVLQHDIKGFSVNAVEQILQWGQANGYTFKALDMTSPTAHHGVNN